MKDHECQGGKTCICSQSALEPDDSCPIHGHSWPPRCAVCGRFMKWVYREPGALEDIDGDLDEIEAIVAMQER